MTLAWIPLLLGACATGELTLSPSSLDFGEVDFNDEPKDCDPDEGGCMPTSVRVENSGDATVSVTGGGWEEDYLCIEGFSGGSLDLGVLNPGSFFDLEIAVCGKDPGYGTPISGAITFTPDSGERAALEWSFTPQRDLGEDTGDP
ncbi:MAG: hypothetical protein VX899_15710 [Myxococcota bacterium]|nr:hypothetical protein [Myxococcota bacterium]